jgi:hypothetical protein
VDVGSVGYGNEFRDNPGDYGIDIEDPKAARFPRDFGYADTRRVDLGQQLRRPHDRDVALQEARALQAESRRAGHERLAR